MSSDVVSVYSTEFYSLIPHDFGLKDPPVLSHISMVKKNFKMLEILSDLHENQRALNSIIDGLKKENPATAIKGMLGTDFETIGADSEVYKHVVNSLKSTHAPSHNFSLEVESVVGVKSLIQEFNYKPFEEASNKKLLWHGAKLSNLG